MPWNHVASVPSAEVIRDLRLAAMERQPSGVP